MGELVTGILKVKIRIVLWALKAALYFNLEYWLWGQFSFSCSLYLCSTQGTASFIQFSSVQSLSRVRLCVTLWTAACQASLSITNSKSLLKLMSIEWVMPSNHLILCCPLLFPPSIFPSIRVFSNESVLHIRWPKYYLCTKTVCHGDSPFTFQAFIKAMGKTLNQLSCVSWVSLHGYLLITSLAFSILPEDWNL